MLLDVPTKLLGSSCDIFPPEFLFLRTYTAISERENLSQVERVEKAQKGYLDLALEINMAPYSRRIEGLRCNSKVVFTVGGRIKLAAGSLNLWNLQLYCYAASRRKSLSILTAAIILSAKTQGGITRGLRDRCRFLGPLFLLVLITTQAHGYNDDRVVCTQRRVTLQQGKNNFAKCISVEECSSSSAQNLNLHCCQKSRVYTVGAAMEWARCLGEVTPGKPLHFPALGLLL